MSDISSKAHSRPNVDISKLSDEDLTALISTAQEEISNRRERKKADFLISFREAMNALGLSPAEVAASLGRGPGKSNRDSRIKVAPKYRNPLSPEETWSGRGKRPKWLQVQLGKGRKLEEFAAKRGSKRGGRAV